MTGLELRSVVEADIPLLADIAHASPEAPQWSPAVYRSLLRKKTSGVVHEVVAGTAAGELVGFGVLSVLTSVSPPEAEIETLAVSPTFRRQGLGRMLLGEMLRRAETYAAAAVLLEVRSRNAAALSLYRQAGFVQVGTRRGYYRGPDDNAVLMRALLR